VGGNDAIAKMDEQLDVPTILLFRRMAYAQVSTRTSTKLGKWTDS
jgi:hypothetical protein